MPTFPTSPLPPAVTMDIARALAAHLKETTRAEWAVNIAATDIGFTDELVLEAKARRQVGATVTVSLDGLTLADDVYGMLAAHVAELGRLLDQDAADPRVAELKAELAKRADEHVELDRLRHLHEAATDNNVSLRIALDMMLGILDRVPNLDLDVRDRANVDAARKVLGS